MAKTKFISIIITLAVLAGAVFAAARSVFPLRYDETIKSRASAHELDPSLLAAIVFVESGFDRSSESPAGALGLMQLMPETAGWAAARMKRPELADGLTRAVPNLTLGAWYYRYLLDKYEDERLALAAYNGGERNLDKWIAVGSGDPESVVENIPFEETRRFVGKVRDTKRIYRLLYPGLRSGPGDDT